MSPPSEQSKLPLFAAVVLYGIVVSAAVWRHEPWADEAQAWLLARDSGLIELWTHRLGYEGTPGAWHSLLYILTRADAPYRALNVLSAVLGFVAAWLVLYHSPFPLWVRLSLPFTFFLCYQYAVIARSYSCSRHCYFAARRFGGRRSGTGCSSPPFYS